ncbi:hypothetical protein D3C85_1638370 [compost metagenome]
MCPGYERLPGRLEVAYKEGYALLKYAGDEPADLQTKDESAKEGNLLTQIKP